MPSTVDRLIEDLVSSGLLSPDVVRDLQGSLAEVDAENPHRLIAALVQAQRLTAFQAEEVEAGRTRGLVLGNYLLLDRIGQGGMGQVFKVEHRRMKRIAALKVLPASLAKDEQALQRFQREVEAAARLSHPNIVTAYDADEAGGVHFLVMEFVEGLDLRALVAQHGPLPVGQAVVCIQHAARGLEYAHQQGLVHRDVKPGNLLLDAAGTVKLLDLGLARFSLGATNGSPQPAELTQSGSILGTVDYLAPEQALDVKRADRRADIYSLGCTLHYLLTGQPLFAGETMVEKLLSHRERPAPSLRQRRVDVPAELDQVYLRMVAKQPGDRYATMAEVFAALEALPLSNVLQPSAWTPANLQALRSGQSAQPSTIGQQETMRLSASAGPTQAIPPTPSGAGKRWARNTVLVGSILLLAGLAAAGVVWLRSWPMPPGTLLLHSNEANATVQVVNARNEVAVTLRNGAAQTSLDLTPGAHRVIVEKLGFRSAEKPFTIASGKTTRVDVELTPLAPAASSPAAGDTAAIGVPAIDPEVAAAEWVLKAGGKLTVLMDGKTQVINSRDKLEGKLFRVTEVDLQNNKFVADEDLRMFAGLSKFRMLNLSGTDISDRGMDQLAALGSLQWLSLDRTRISDAGAGRLRNLSNLTALSVAGPQITFAAAEHFQSLPNLQSLTLGSSQPSDAGLRCIKDYPALRHLAFSGSALSDSTFEQLAQARSLESLRIQGGSVRGAILAPLKQLPLTRLSIASDQITDENLAGLGDLKALTSLSLMGCSKIDGSCLSSLKEPHELNFLWLDNTALTDSNLIHVKHLVRLEDLGLMGTSISDTGLENIRGLTKLRILWLTGTKVTDQGLSCLSGLTNLTTLYLERTPITDEAIQHLKPLISVKFLNISGTRISPAAVESLKAGLPQCNIVSNEMKG